MGARIKKNIILQNNYILYLVSKTLRTVYSKSVEEQHTTHILCLLVGRHFGRLDGSNRTSEMSAIHLHLHDTAVQHAT